MPNYPYALAAFPTQKVDIPVLQATIEGSPIVDPVTWIDVNVTPGQCDINFLNALTPAEVATLDAIVASHWGIGYVSTLLGSTSILDVAVTQDAIWQVLGGVVTTPTFFSPDLSQISGRIVGELQGDGGQLRIMEAVAGQPDVEMISPPYECPDTLGAWQSFGVSSNVQPRAGYQNVYRVEGRLNGAVALSVRFTTINMIQVILYSS